MAKANARVELLMLNKKEFKQQVFERLKIGREFVKRKMSTKEESGKCWMEFVMWDNYNLEMIRQAFEYPDNSYAEDYNRNKSSGGGIFIPGVYKEPTIAESIQNTRDEMSSQVWKFERFFDKIELFRVKETPVSNGKESKSDLDSLLNLLKRFHKVAQELRLRRTDRQSVLIKDEYDVQYLLGALLKLYFNDIRSEEYSPSNSGANSRLDFVLKDEKIIIETKMTNEHLKVKSLGDELLIDIGRYKAYSNCKTLVIFIYDKGDYIPNKPGLIYDLEKHSTSEMNVSVIVVPD